MWRKIYLILIGRSICYIGLKQTYTLQTVPQVGIIVHFAKCLEFAAFKTGGGGMLRQFFWNWMDSMDSETSYKVIVTFRYIKREKIVFHCF